MKNAFDILRERGFIEQITDEDAIKDLLRNAKVTCYIGFDPTAPSLHVGHLLPIMSLTHMQKAGHRPIALVGGGTALIGDPSGKTEMRRILTREQIDHNARCLQKQLSNYLDFSDGGALLLNNADWLAELNYIAFLRDIGRHFSVNKMLAAESYRMRLERGLNFIEFNYMLLQAYDFLHLFDEYGCMLQMGGNDQWGNMLAGSDLIRRMKGKGAFAMTFPLITTSSGHKMGKTEKGTVWLDGRETSPYAYYQYWANTEDADVERFLGLFTFLPMEEISAVCSLEGSERNMAKTVLAFEATKVTHGEEAALDAWKAAVQTFHVRPVRDDLFPSSTLPRTEPDRDGAGPPSIGKTEAELEQGIAAFELFFESGLCATKSEARRLLSQGGGYVNNRQVGAFDEKIGLGDRDEGGRIRLRKGKKRYVVVEVVQG
ncbi:MAG: tyrosine--tRNA ligase [Deltaproteobacteria bacterium]|nr:tyrosine--tRNA ligase [Deltaproteobacteria bacterium]